MQLTQQEIQEIKDAMNNVHRPEAAISLANSCIAGETTPEEFLIEFSQLTPAGKMTAYNLVLSSRKIDLVKQIHGPVGVEMVSIMSQARG